MVQYHDEPVIYDIVMQEENVYHLRVDESHNRDADEYIPHKIIIRKKGMIWISDNENYPELINALTEEIATYTNTSRTNQL